MKPALLVILDGFGFGDPGHPCNAVALAHTPCLDRLRTGPWVEIDNNQHHVGLPEGQMGNSEVGHLNIGAGRIVYQDFLRINKAIEEGTFAKNDAYQEAFEHVRKTGGRLHLIGLLGPGGVHAHENHFAAALQAAAGNGIEDVLVHPIGDGRDTDPRSGKHFMQTLQAQIEEAGVGRVVDLVGRYYAMDRDKRWERVENAYRLYAEGTAERTAPDPQAAIDACYEAGQDDEFWTPVVIEDGAVRDGDAVVWLNFRPDRSREMTGAFMDPDFDGFDRGPAGGERGIVWVCTTQYDDRFVDWPGICIAYGPQRPTHTLGEHVSRLGLRQLRIAETEKYAHVTYFFSGGREEPFDGEERVLIPSPRVATYDLQPEMSAGEVTDRLLHALGSEDFDLLVVNYANPDMVGHTGNLDAAVEMMEFIDNCLDRLTSVATELGYVTLITSDHGNCEEMCKSHKGERGERTTNHTMLPSPLIVVNGGDIQLREGGALCDVAPTLLDLMGLDKPAEMGESLVVRRASKIRS